MVNMFRHSNGKARGMGVPILEKHLEMLEIFSGSTANIWNNMNHQETSGSFVIPLYIDFCDGIISQHGIYR